MSKKSSANAVLEDDDPPGRLVLAVHPLLADQTRLAIMVALASSRAAVDFAFLLESLNLTKGNLSTHLRKLEEADLVQVRREFDGRKPHSSYRATSKGLKALDGYLHTVETALRGIGAAREGKS